MAKYREKEHGWIFEAIQWHAFIQRDDVISCGRTSGVLVTENGRKNLTAGDWLVEGPDGVTYKVDDATLRQKFEPVDGGFVPQMPLKERMLAEERKSGEAALVAGAAMSLRDALKEGKDVNFEPPEITGDAEADDQADTG